MQNKEWEFAKMEKVCYTNVTKEDSSRIKLQNRFNFQSLVKRPPIEHLGRVVKFSIQEETSKLY